MSKVPYDVTGVKSKRSTRLRRVAVASDAPSPNGTKPASAPEPGSFAARVTARRVDLVRLVENGLPPIQFLPASDGMLVRGKRHLIAAPAKTGKSIGMEAHWVDMTLAGARVAILDRENGQDIYARRLADIFDGRKLSQKERNRIRAGLDYYEFPELHPRDAPALVEHFAGVDLVVFDAQRMFLSDLGLKEKESDDYAAFMSYAVDPIFRAGVATLILDNTGHSERTRARGASTKGDLNEVLFSMETTADFDLHRTGELRLKVERSRFGNHGEWMMEIGGGVFGAWQSLTERPTRDDFREAVLAVLADGKTRGQDKLLTAVRGRGVRIATGTARSMLGRYVHDPAVPIAQTPSGYRCEGS